jgi:hypothetical protein
MPSNPPHYSIPPIPATGNAEVDNALTEWQQQFGQQYRESQESVSRTPFIVSTFSQESTSNPKGNYMSKSVTLLGGEQVQVIGIFDFSVSAGGTLTSGGASFAELAIGRLKVQYPGGSTFVFGSGREAVFRVSHSGQNSSNNGQVKSTVASRASVSFSWPIEARIQSGGEHTFTLYTSGAGTINSGQMTVVVL